MHNWLRLLRWKNLLVIALTQWGVYYRYFKNLEGKFWLQPLDFNLLLVCTLCVAAGGFIINDIFDMNTDVINRPLDRPLTGGAISVRSAINGYYLISGAGLLIAMYLSMHNRFYCSFLLYPISVYIFWIYSYRLKSTVLWGNIFVSIFVAGVILLLPYAFSDGMGWLQENDPGRYFRIWKTILTLSVFVFLSNLFREVVKDIEDFHGDHVSGFKTTAVVLGLDRCRIVLCCVMVLQFLLLIGLIVFFPSENLNFAFVLLVLCPWLVISYWLWKNRPGSYRKWSAASKISMVSGLAYFILT